MSRDQLFLAHVPLFATLPSAELARLESLLHTIQTDAPTVLFREGDYGAHLYIVREGEIEVIKGLGTADERVIDRHGPGQFVGEMSLFNPDGHRTAAVRTRGAARLWRMTRADFTQLLERQPLLAYEIVRVLTARLTNAHNNAIRDLQEKNREITRAYEELKTAQAQIIEKEKLERELELAFEIQMSLLPRALPRLDEFAFGARMIPARIVGGDLYEFIPLANEKLGVLVGDVSGKGVPAAIFMAQTHALLKSEATRGGSPGETLKRVNSLLLEMNAAHFFVTVLYGVLDTKTRAFTFARAGHESPLVCDAQGQVTAAPWAYGQPLGVFDELNVSEQTVRLEPGSTLLLFTDGLIDAIDARGNPFGEERLRDSLRALYSLSAQELCNQLLAEIQNFAHSTVQFDDLAVVAIKAL